jgi:hypothetical protein
MKEQDEQQDWLLKLEAGALTQDDYESLASAPRSEVRATRQPAARLGVDAWGTNCKAFLIMRISLLSFF